MADTVVKRIELFFQEGTSDKTYVATWVKHDDSTHSVMVQWGRRGASLSQGNKAVRVDEQKAQKTYDRLVQEKVNKGYAPAGEVSGSPTPKRATLGPKAQLLTPMDDDDVDSYVDDKAWVAQQKCDGIRILCTVENKRVLPTNRDGQESDHVPKAILDGLDALPVGTIVDGELLEGVYWVFDVLRVGERDVTSLGVVERWNLMDDELSPGFSGDVQVLPLHTTTKAKRALITSLQAQRAEGVVFKQRDAPYVGGRVSTQRKLKFIKSCDVVITENSGNAYTMQLEGVSVGKVFAGTTNASRAALDKLLASGKRPICEVQYLYATQDEQLYQPVFVRIRDDKSAADCKRSQLQKTNKSVARG
jgi:bifunctional non-homologous end joining protein LigD